MSGARLSTGGLIDRSRPLRFSFEGRSLTGFSGDTVASALLANGVRITGRSFKYHRPRGIFGAGSEDAGAMVARLSPRPATNLLATMLPLEDGAVLSGLNAWPSVDFDIGAAAGWMARLLPAGFYYKTFMRPTWHLFEPFIRAAAGLGRVPDPAWEPVSESRFGHCDVLVVGAGPAGLAAASTAARAGADVMLVDDGLSPGGRLVGDGALPGDGSALGTWLGDSLAALAGMDNVRVLPRSTVWSHQEHDFLTVIEREPADGSGLDFRHWKLRARRVVIAAGGFERAIAIAGNDRPGVMLASAVRSHLHRHAARAGERAVVFTTNDSAYATARDLARAGAAVTLVDARPEPAAALVAGARELGVVVHAGGLVTDIHGKRGVEGVDVLRAGGGSLRVECDLVAISGGWNPAFHIASQTRRARSVWDERLASFVATHDPTEPFRLAGTARGVLDTAGCLADGAAAGAWAAEGLGLTAPATGLPAVEHEAEGAILPLWHVPGRRPREKAFVDLSGDVTIADVGLALREGYDSIELLKRYTTAGMGVDQGKSGNVGVIAIVGALTGQAPQSVGTTTFRPPFVPVEFGAIAGHRHGARLYPFRHTPLTAHHVAAGAVIYEVGLRWQRPGYHPAPGEGWAEAARREARAVREAVGVYDGTPLGKFELKGPDVPALLDLVYTSDFGGLGVGRGKYGLMLTEDGLVLDDGVTFRLSQNRWLLHSSTGAADRIWQHLETILQVLHRPDWRVALTPVTSQWVNATLCGPRAREVLTALSPDFEVSAEAFPFMSLREGVVAGLPARVCRVSWTGEASFEINVPARHGPALWDAILAAGAPLGITRVGSEANHILRVEAGYISTGHEVDGTVDPIDLGLGGMISRKKADFIGKRAMEIRRRAEPTRMELVGFLPQNGMVPEGAPITPGGTKADQEGFVSACVDSVARGGPIALGLLRGGRARIGETVHARVGETIHPLVVTPPVFHDADRQRVKS